MTVFGQMTILRPYDGIYYAYSTVVDDKNGVYYKASMRTAVFVYNISPCSVVDAIKPFLLWILVSNLFKSDRVFCFDLYQIFQFCIEFWLHNCEDMWDKIQKWGFIERFG